MSIYTALKRHSKPGFFLARKNNQFLAFGFNYLLCVTAIVCTTHLNAEPVCAVYNAGAPCTVSADPGTAVRRHLPQTLLANLADSSSGNVFVRQQDYQHPHSQLSYIRYYNSLLASQTTASGFGWRSSYSVNLQKLSEQSLLLTQADGRQSVFSQKNGRGVFVSDDPGEGSIESDRRYLKWTTGEGNSVSFLGPFPVHYAFKNNTSLDLYYQDNQLRKITDNFGNELNLSYDSANPGRLLNLTLPDRSMLRYQYSDGQLISVKRKQEIINSYAYGHTHSGKQLSQITDTLLARQRTLQFDNNGRLEKLTDSQGTKNITFNWPGETTAHEQGGTIATSSSGINRVVVAAASANKQQLTNARDQRILRQLLIADSDQCSNTDPSNDNNGLLTAVDIAETSNEQQCSSTDSSGAENTSPIIPGAIFREVFATDCLSYFDAYAGTGRGFKIEEAFMQHESFADAQATATRFPVLDFLGNRVAVAIVSRDLRSPSYSDPANDSALYNKLLADAAHMHHLFLDAINTDQQISATQGGLTTTIHASDFDSFVFELVVQRGAATAAHMAQIKHAAATMLKLYGIKLQVVEIP